MPTIIYQTGDTLHAPDAEGRATHLALALERAGGGEPLEEPPVREPIRILVLDSDAAASRGLIAAMRALDLEAMFLSESAQPFGHLSTEQHRLGIRDFNDFASIKLLPVEGTVEDWKTRSGRHALRSGKQAKLAHLVSKKGMTARSSRGR